MKIENCGSSNKNVHKLTILHRRSLKNDCQQALINVCSEGPPKKIPKNPRFLSENVKENL